VKKKKSKTDSMVGKTIKLDTTGKRRVRIISDGADIMIVETIGKWSFKKSLIGEDVTFGKKSFIVKSINGKRISLERVKEKADESG